MDRKTNRSMEITPFDAARRGLVNAFLNGSKDVFEGKLRSILEKVFFRRKSFFFPTDL